MGSKSKEELEKNIQAIEVQMAEADFWMDKETAQAAIRELQSLKDELEGVGRYDKGGAVMTIFSGAGGDDAEDFSRLLFEMYQKLSSAWAGVILWCTKMRIITAVSGISPLILRGKKFTARSRMNPVFTG